MSKIVRAGKVHSSRSESSFCVLTLFDRHYLSWTVRKLFNLRDIGQPLIRYVVGDLCNISLWLDNRHSLGPLYKHFGEEAERNLGTSLQAKVSTIVSNGDWIWQRQRNRIVRIEVFVGLVSNSGCDKFSECIHSL